MKKKVILICIDGMRPDGLKACGNPYVEELERMCAHTYCAKTVFPSETMQAHMSMVYSVTPQEHGTLTYQYVKPTCKAKGLFDVIHRSALKGNSAMFYGWGRLRDLAGYDALAHSSFIKCGSVPVNTDPLLTDEAERALTNRIESGKPFDFVFLYLPETDEEGHKNGWMTETYLQRINVAIDCVKRMIDRFGEEYDVILMTDHGGHDKTHGLDIPEDMTIPLFFYGEEFKGGEVLEDLSILDVAPTVTKLLGIDPDENWKGKPVF